MTSDDARSVTPLCAAASAFGTRCDLPADHVGPCSDASTRFAAPVLPSPEFITREALRLLASWDDAGNPEQYVDDIRIDLAVEVVARTYQRAQERSR